MPARQSLILPVVLIPVILAGTATAGAGSDDVPRPASDTAQLIGEVGSLIDTIAERHAAQPSAAGMRHAVLAAFAVDSEKSGSPTVSVDTTPESATADITASEFEVRFADAIRNQAQIPLPETSLPQPPNTETDASSRVMTITLAALSRHLHDPVWLSTAEEQRVSEQLAANRYVGIGIQLATDDERRRPVTPKVFEGGPASEAGMLDNDILISVDGQDTENVSLADVVRWLRGPEGTEVTVQVRSPDAEEIRSYTMTRGVVPIATVEKPVLTDDQSAAGIRVLRVAASTVRELRRLEQQLPADVSHVVLDLSACISDDLHNVVLLASALIDGGGLGSVRSVQGKRDYVADPGQLFPGRTLSVVIGAHSAARVCWLAAAVSDTGTGRVFSQLKLPTYPEHTRAWQRDPVAFGARGSLATFATGELLRDDGQPLIPFLQTLTPLIAAEGNAPTAGAADPAGRSRPADHREAAIPMDDILSLVVGRLRETSGSRREGS